MEITQEKIDIATSKIENHLRDLGIKNNFSLLKIEQNEDENSRVFYFEVANPTFKTIIQCEVICLTRFVFLYYIK